MNQTSDPSGAASSASAASSEVSQWLYLHTALGNGYIAPLPYVHTWVISSGVPVELTYRMRAAENMFHAHHEKSVASDRAQLEGLEQMAQAAKTSPRGGGGPSGGDLAKISAQIKELKDRLARPVFVNYRDWTADRSTMLELLSKSKFRAMSFVDELGIRAHNYTVNKFLAARHISADIALLSLSGDQSSDSVLIRSSATGGASMLSVRGDNAPRFNLMTLTSPQAVLKIQGRLKEAAPCHGLTLVLPTPPAATLGVPSDQISKVIRKVYATENPDHRVVVTITPAWHAFLAITPEEVAPSVAALASLWKSLVSVQTLVGSLTRAAITRKFFLTEADIADPTTDRTLALDDSDLAVAQQWLRELAPTLFGMKHIESKRKNAEVAREAWISGPSAESLSSAKAALIKAIQADEHRMVSANAAARMPGISARTLDAVLESNPGVFEVTIDGRRPGAKRTAERMITLAENWRSGSVGGSTQPELGNDHPDETKDLLYREWQKQAHDNLDKLGRPVIEIAELPPVLRSAVIGVQRRFWQTTTLIPSGPKKAIDGQPGMELWFRNSPIGGDMCAWSESFREWKLYEKWQDKDATTRAEREAISDPYSAGTEG
jgi:hypothetical protein